jgi:hypothetical protein
MRGSNASLGKIQYVKEVRTMNASGNAFALRGHISLRHPSASFIGLAIALMGAPAFAAFFR